MSSQELLGSQGQHFLQELLKKMAQHFLPGITAGKLASLSSQELPGKIGKHLLRGITGKIDTNTLFRKQPDQPDPRRQSFSPNPSDFWIAWRTARSGPPPHPGRRARPPRLDLLGLVLVSLAFLDVLVPLHYPPHWPCAFRLADPTKRSGTLFWPPTNASTTSP